MANEPLYVNNLSACPPEYAEAFTHFAEKSGKPDYGKPNCYKCKNQGSVPGSAHSKCLWFQNNIKGTARADLFAYEMMIASSIMLGMITDIPAAEIDDKKLPMVGLHRIGLKGGWALWPVDFDPTWILWCLGFDPKED